jgi:signal transduction histidine kinase
VSLKKHDDWFEMRVRDNGTGIREDRIRDPKSLGLIGMRERVHSLGGKLWVSGNKNEGTTVKVAIPIDKKGKIFD